MLCSILKKESVRCKPEDVYDISVEDHHNFILSNGAIVHNCDTFQSAQIQQQLIGDGFDVKTISVDRLDPQTKQCLPYAYLKSAIYDRRLEVYKECDFLTEEVLGLERESDGHINHPDNGSRGSKDAIDAVTGALFNASQNADEIGYSYGENLQNMIDINDDHNDINQLTIDLEDELRKMGPVLTPNRQQPDDVPGNGQQDNNSFNSGATSDFNPYDNILIW